MSVGDATLSPVLSVNFGTRAKAGCTEWDKSDHPLFYGELNEESYRCRCGDIPSWFCQ